MEQKTRLGSFCIDFGISGFLISVLNAIIFAIQRMQFKQEMRRMATDDALLEFFPDFFRLLANYKYIYALCVLMLIIGFAQARNGSAPRLYMPRGAGPTPTPGAANARGAVPGCPACGCPLEPGGVFCGGCGRKI